MPCRAEAQILFAKSALKSHLANPWAALTYGKLCNTLNDKQGVFDAFAIATNQLVDSSENLDPVKVEWMRLLAKLDAGLFREFGRNFEVHVRDAVLYDFGSRELGFSETLLRYSRKLATYVNIEPRDAFTITNMTKEINFCSNQHLEWHDASAVGIEWLREVLAILAEAKSTHTALSVVRLGDGEALFLQGLRPSLAGAAGRHQGGGYRELSQDEFMLAKGNLEDAIRDADLLLLPDLRQVLFGPINYWRVWAEVDRIRGFDSGVFGGSCSLGFSLEQHGLTGLLVSLVTGVIGPADPEGSVLFSGRQIKWIPIPGEVDKLDKSGSTQSHFHNYYSRINSLRFYPGEVWLVAGGILGKSYCNTIRRNGGIAIDIG